MSYCLNQGILPQTGAGSQQRRFKLESAKFLCEKTGLKLIHMGPWKSKDQRTENRWPAAGCDSWRRADIGLRSAVSSPARLGRNFGRERIRGIKKQKITKTLKNGAKIHSRFGIYFIGEGDCLHASLFWIDTTVDNGNELVSLIN